MLTVYILHLYSLSVVQPDDGLDIAETCSCVFINNKTNVSCAGLNLSSFKCKNRNGMSNIKIKYFVHATGCVQRIRCCLANWLWE